MQLTVAMLILWWYHGPCLPPASTARPFSTWQQPWCAPACAGCVLEQSNHGCPVSFFFWLSLLICSACIQMVDLYISWISVGLTTSNTWFFALGHLSFFPSHFAGYIINSLLLSWGHNMCSSLRRLFSFIPASVCLLILNPLNQLPLSLTHSPSTLRQHTFQPFASFLDRPDIVYQIFSTFLPVPLSDTTHFVPSAKAMSRQWDLWHSPVGNITGDLLMKGTFQCLLMCYSIFICIVLYIIILY